MTTVKNIFAILTGLTFVACNNSATDNKKTPTSSDTIETVSSSTDNSTLGIQELSDKKESDIVVKNKADYSDEFMQGLKELGYNRIQLIDSLLIIDNKDTVIFSQTPKIGEQRVYTGRQDDLAIALTVKRTNYTTVDYKIEMVEFGKTSHNQNGRADLIPSFFLGAESNEDEQTGDGYFVTQYSDNRENDCYTHIRLGDEDKIAKIIKNCNGKIKDITLGNFTTLYQLHL
jgi:hypothetical protein